MPLYEIETERLLLRPFTHADLDRMAEIYANPDVMRYMRTGKPSTREQAERTVNWLVKYPQEHDGLGLFAAVNKADNVLMGQCGLFHLDNTEEVEVAYLIAQEYWGNGLVTEGARASLRFGFEVFNLDHIAAVAKPENSASRRVMEKCGLTFKRIAHFYDQDLVYYSLARADWQPDASHYQLRTLA